MRTSNVLGMVAVVGLPLAAPAAAANLIANAAFDENISSWDLRSPPPQVSRAWSPISVEGAADSGSARVTNLSTTAGSGLAPLSQCVPVTAGATYEFSGHALVPSGQARSGRARFYTIWHGEPGCAGDGFGQGGPGFEVAAIGAWTLATASDEAPLGAVSVAVYLGVGKDQAGGSLFAHFDDVVLCRAGECEGTGDEGWVTTDEFPGFRFRVTITPADGPPFFASKVPEADCLDKTLCMSGALANRAEVLLRLIGPRPNGFLWLQVNRFSPHQIDIDVEQTSRAATRVYHLDSIPSDDDTLNGFYDRTAFLP